MASASKQTTSRSTPTGSPRSAGTSRRPSGKTAWRTNWRLLIGTLLAFAAMVPVAYFWHAHQVKRNAAMFLARADDLERDEQWGDAVKYIDWYLKIYPDDVGARVRLAQAFDHLADDSPRRIPAAERLYSIAIGLSPDQANLRRRHAERLMELGRFHDAAAEIDEALKREPGDATALGLKANAAYADALARGDFSEAVQLVANFREALKAAAGKPEQIELAIQLAEVYRRGLKEPSPGERRTLANQVVDEMVAAHEERPAAWIARYLYQQRNDGKGADDDLDRALALDTDKSDARVQLAAAEWAKSRGEAESASEYYDRVIVADPTSDRAYLGLAELQASQQEYEPAIATLKRGLQAVRTDDRLNLELTLATVYLSARKLDDADQLLTTLNRRASALKGQMSPEATARISATLAVLRAQWHMEKRQYSQAVQLLKGLLSAQPAAASGQDMMPRVQSLMQLGQCYTALRHWDQAAMAFQEAAALKPQELGPQIAAATAWQSAGRSEEAMQALMQSAARPDATDGVWALLADAQIRQQVSAAEKSRDWKAVEQSLARGLELFPDSKLLEAVKSQLDDLRAGTQKSLSRAGEALTATPQSRVLAERLMLAYEAEGQKDKADEIEQKFLATSEDPIDKLLLRATWSAMRQKVGDAHDLLTQAVREAPEERHAEIKFRLARLGMYLGQKEEAREILKDLVASDSHNETLLEMLADLALETRDLNELAHWEEELKKLEGPEGSGWRFYRVQRLLNQQGGTDEQQLQEAERLTADIERIRPMWATGIVLQGLIAERRGLLEEAIEAYRKAVDLGERQPLVAEQLLNLLHRTNQSEEVEKYLARLGDAAMLSPRIANIAIASRIRAGDAGNALKLAEEETKRRPKDVMSHVALGESLVASGKPDEAEAAFRKAVAIAPQDPRAWQGLFAFQLMLSGRDQARKTLEGMTATLKLPERELLTMLAQDHLLLGDRAAAEETYRRLLKAAPDDEAALRRVASFFASQDPALAERCLRHALELKPTSRLTQLELAALLISRGADDQLTEAMQLLQSPADGTPTDRMQQSLIARLLLRRLQGDDRERGKQLLEELVARGQASDDDHTTLIGMYEAEGRLRKATEHAFVLATRKNPTPANLANYIDLLLKEQRASEATPWLAKLSKVDPDSFATVSLSARLLAAKGKKKDAEKTVEADLQRRMAQAESVDDKAQLLLAVGRLYGQIDLAPQAEHVLRQLAASSPAGYQHLAVWLAKQRRNEEAVDLCLQAGATDKTSQGAIVLVRSLILGNPDKNVRQKAEPALATAATTHSDDAAFLGELAMLRLLEERNDEGIRLLRQVLMLNPRDAVAINNLAGALGDKAQTRAEAQQLIDSAIAQAGPLTEFLDTKGTLLLSDGNVEGAAKLFEEATSRSSSDPRHLLHLALALKQAGKPRESREALERASKSGLDSARLTPAQKRQLAELKRNLQGQRATAHN